MAPKEFALLLALLRAMRAVISRLQVTGSLGILRGRQQDRGHTYFRVALQNSRRACPRFPKTALSHEAEQNWSEYHEHACGNPTQVEVPFDVLRENSHLRACEGSDSEPSESRAGLIGVNP
jgi:hypothetical protein